MSPTTGASSLRSVPLRSTKSPVVVPPVEPTKRDGLSAIV
jgi:hypothetical protein